MSEDEQDTMPMGSQGLIPRVVMWAAGAVGAFALARMVQREYRRVNDELDAARLATVTSKGEQDKYPTLKRDPQTGIYHP